MAPDLHEYVLRRLLAAVPVLLVVSFVVFLLVRLVPGGPAVSMLGADADPEQIRQVREAMGLDEPLPVQYGQYLWDLLHGDLGRSFVTGDPVAARIAARLPTTLSLSLAGFVVALSIAVPAGTVGALRHDTPADYAALAFGLLGVSVPNFWLGLFLLLVFGVHLDLFPVSGYVAPWQDPVAGLRYLVLPAVTLGTAMAAIVTRMLRAELLEETGKEYLAALRMRGLREATVFRHALKNAFVPVLTVIGMQFGYLLGGALVVEVVFSIPGMGRLLLTAIEGRDYVMVQGIVVSLVGLFVLVNLVVDVAYFYLNPKLREA